MSKNTIKHYSMTGYGKGVCEDSGLKITVEMKSVNHRFLDLSIRTPKNYMFAEDMIRNKVKEHVFRGHLDIFVNVDDCRDKHSTLLLDENLAKEYLRVSKELEVLGYCQDMSVSTLLSMPEILRPAYIDEDEKLLEALILDATSQAVKNMQKMRLKEGTNLVKDLLYKIHSLQELVSKIKEYASVISEDYKKSLSSKLAEALKEEAISPSRIEAEITLFVDKASIDEETTRLESHLNQYIETFLLPGPIGKKLDFLTQETHREINTIASKSVDIKITRIALTAKNIIEAIREQVQNLE